MKKRTKKFALEAIKFSESLPHTRAGNIIVNQQIRAATSVGANYRVACRARSKADFVSKIGITLEESDKSAYWTEIITESGMKLEQETFVFLNEANELVAIFVASSNTAHSRSRPRR